MEEQFTKQTIKQYWPVIKAMYAYLEVRIRSGKEDKNGGFSFWHMENEFRLSDIISVGHIFHIWLKGSDFDFDQIVIIRLNKDTGWIDLIKLLEKKINEYEDNINNTIEISLSDDGIMFREINGKRYQHDFKDDGLKKRIITFLSRREDFTKTTIILKSVECTNNKSFSEAVRQINTITEQKLSLPKNQKLVQSKKNSGYRINQLYNIVPSE